MKKQGLFATHHCVFTLTYHLVLTTKYRRKVIDKNVLERLDEIFNATLDQWRCTLIEFNGEEDHVHLLFEGHPAMQLSQLVNNLKTVSSRLIRRDFKAHVAHVYGQKAVFWHRSYCVLSTGGASVDVIKKYIEDQGDKHSNASHPPATVAPQSRRDCSGGAFSALKR